MRTTTMRSDNGDGVSVVVDALRVSGVSVWRAPFCVRSRKRSALRAGSHLRCGPA